MDDKEIVSLYFERNENAVSETDKKYGAYLKKVAYNILSDIEDSEEKVNDTYFRAWNIIPPNKPEKLLPFLVKLCRGLSIDAYRKKHSRKRNNSVYALALDEISECVPSAGTAETEFDAALLAREINEFISSLDEEQRNVFVCRYFFFDSINDISAYYSMSESKVKSILFRLRNRLKSHLLEEGDVYI